MHEILRTYINQNIPSPIPDEDFELVSEAFTMRKLRRRQYILQEGDVSKQLTFIVKGAMRQYSVDEKGVEHIVRFGLENWWMFDRESFEMETPSKYNIDALEDCELLQLSRASYHRLTETVPSYRLLVMELEKRGQIAAQRRIHAAISLSAEERYQDLVKQNPMFLQRIPQNMIASYLGISPETLSRVRKQSVK